MTAATTDVYRPQHDSWLLVEALEHSNMAADRRVVDLCTGSGIVAVAAAELGARTVTALDVSLAAVHCTRAHALAARVRVDARLGSWTRAMEGEPFDCAA